MKLKICGVQSAEEARLLTEKPVDYIGLNFVPSSKRCISVNTGKSIVSALAGSHITPIALFQNAESDHIMDIIDELGIKHIQLHGAETTETHGVLAEEYTIIKAIYGQSEPIKDQVDSFSAAYYLLDRPLQGKGNTTSQKDVFDAISETDKLFVAGGITPNNLTDVIGQYRPYAIDVAGGVRNESQELDVDLLDQLIEQMEIL